MSERRRSTDLDVAPGADAFAASYDLGTVQLVSTRLVADLETPVSAYMKLAKGQAMSFLLESVEGGEKWARYSFLGVGARASACAGMIIG